MNSTPIADVSEKLSDLIFAVALAEDAAQDAEDREQYARASKIRGQIRAMNAEIAALRAAS